MATHSTFFKAGSGVADIRPVSGLIDVLTEALYMMKYALLILVLIALPAHAENKTFEASWQIPAEADDVTQIVVEWLLNGNNITFVFVAANATSATRSIDVQNGDEVSASIQLENSVGRGPARTPSVTATGVVSVPPPVANPAITQLD